VVVVDELGGLETRSDSGEFDEPAQGRAQIGVWITPSVIIWNVPRGTGVGPPPSSSSSVASRSACIRRAACARWVTADVGSGRGPVSVTGPAIIVWRILTKCVFDGIDGLVHCWFDVSNDLDEEWGVGLGAAFHNSLMRSCNGR
jgi:hypothetical protein